MLPALLLALTTQTPDAGLLRACAGSWRAVLTTPGGDLPFELILAATAPEATIVNGSERLIVPEVVSGDGQIELRFPHYDSLLRAKLASDGTTLSGAWEKRTAGEKPVRLDFSALRDGGPRFEHAPPNGDVSGRWRARFESDSADAVALFEQRAGQVTGTFLTRTGDYRYLAGNLAGDRLRLSCFDGAHAFLFDARLVQGKLAGRFISGDRWSESWSAELDPQARLADPWSASRLDSEVPLPMLVYPDLDGTGHSLGEFVLAGRALLIVTFGSWCPNCHDEMRDLAELHRAYRDRGLVIVGLAFEHSGDFERDVRQVRRARARHGVEYPLLLAGPSDKRRAREAFPLLQEIVAFPTTLFFRRDGSLRAIHTGYAGPGTGSEHAAQRAEFERLIVELLDAPDPDERAHEQHLASARWLDQPNGWLTTIFANRLDGRTLLNFTTDDPALDLEPEKRRMHPARARGRSVRLGETGAVYYSEPRGRALLDPFDAGHRLGAEVPNGSVIPQVELPMPLASVRASLSSVDPRQRGEALYSAVRAKEYGGWKEPLDLSPFLDQKDCLLRTQAAWAAGELHDTSVVPRLIELAQHGFAPLRRECARALGRLGSAAARPALEVLARDFDPNVRVQAATALSRLAK